MEKSFVALAAMLWFAAAAVAQDLPKFETFVGYTYVRADSASDVPAFSAHGGGAQFAYNFSKCLGAVADVGAVHTGDLGGNMIDSTFLNFLFGPRLSMRLARIRPYFQLLFGGVYAASSARISIPVDPSTTIFPPGSALTARVGATQTAFAMTAGGGLDIMINKHVSFRPVGLDYYMTRLQNLRSADDNNQNNLRYTTGFNFTFGAQ
jgi:hypothetical protein